MGPGGELYDLYVAPIEAAIQECGGTPATIHPISSEELIRRTSTPEIDGAIGPKTRHG